MLARAILDRFACTSRLTPALCHEQVIWLADADNAFMVEIELSGATNPGHLTGHTADAFDGEYACLLCL